MQKAAFPHKYILHKLVNWKCWAVYMEGASHMAQWWKICLPMQEVRETQVWSLGWEDPQEEEGMATFSSILAWRIPWRGEPGRIQSIWSQRVRHNWNDWISNTQFSLLLASVFVINESILIHYYSLKPIVYSNFPSIYLMIFRCSRIPSRTPHYI